MAEKSANKVISSIKESKSIPFDRVLYALGIRYVGVTVAKKLAYHYQTLDNLQNAEFEDLICVDEIGDRIAQSVISWFKNVDNLLLITRLNESGVQLQIDVSHFIDRTNALQGKSFVISGVFKNHSRDELKSLIDKNSGKNTSSISKKTSYLIAGENMGPSKREKAEKLGIPIISEDEFLSLLQ
jgi:DNA ligase (NAD+)